MKPLAMIVMLAICGCTKAPTQETATYKDAYATWRVEEASLFQRRSEEFEAQSQYYAAADKAGIREVAPNWTQDISDHQLRRVPLNPEASAAVSDLILKTKDAREAWKKAFTARVVQEEIRDRARKHLDVIEARD